MNCLVEICKRIFQFQFKAQICSSFSKLVKGEREKGFYTKYCNWMHFCFEHSKIQIQYSIVSTILLCRIVPVSVSCRHCHRHRRLLFDTLLVWHCCHCQHCCCCCCSCCCHMLQLLLLLWLLLFSQCHPRILHLTVRSRINVVLNCHYGKSFDST